MEKYNGIECLGCQAGIDMCKKARPCFGTPEEFSKIIDAGYAEKLRIDHWVGSPVDSKVKLEDIKDDNPFVELYKTAYKYQQENPNPHEEDVEMLSGGTERDKGYYAPWIPRGTCKFLTEDEKCELHDLGLKPEQGRETCCKGDDSKGNLHYANLWATEEGLAVIEKFKKSVNIN